MTISSTNYVDFSYVLETTPGTIPDTNPTTFTRLPITSVGLNDNLTTTVSEVIRSDRQTDDLVITDAEINGDCNYELVYDDYKPFLIALMQNASGTTTVNTSNGTNLTAATHVITGTGFDSANLAVGIWVKLAGFSTNPSYNTYFKVSDFDATTITLDDPGGIFTVDEAATITITSEYIRNGADLTPNTYTLRKDHGPASSVIYYKGCIVNSMSFDFATGAILTGVTNFVGREAESNATLQSEAFTEVSGGPIMNSVSSLTEVRVEGLPAGTEFSNVNLTVDNQVTQAKAIGILGAADLVSFSLQATASMEIYFQDLSIYDIYKAATAFEFDAVLADAPNADGTPAGNVMVISMPKCKFEELSEPVPGKDEFLLETGSFRALREATESYMIQISFFDAP